MSEIAVRESTELARYERTPVELIAQVQKIQQVMTAVMVPDTHYGVIPGTGTKPTLLKPGAEKLCLLFRLRPEFRREFRRDGDHLEVVSFVSLFHIPTGDEIVHELAGSCSTRETKYRWRNGKRKCPDCSAEALVRSTKKSAYFCISNEGGCGKRYGFTTEQAKAIDSQEVGKIENPDLADMHNTVLKMADKRALVAASLIATGASDIFAQDLEDLPGVASAPAAGQAASTSTPPAGNPATPTDQGSPPGAAEKGATPGRPEDPLIAEADKKALFGKAQTKGLSPQIFQELMVAVIGTDSTNGMTHSQLVALDKGLDEWKASEEQQTIDGEATEVTE